MKFNDLQVKQQRKSKRVGRGISAGQGKTAGRGTKGQKSRKGYSARPGFEGGQNPLMQRLPKLPGFRSHRPKAEIVYTGQLDQFGTKIVDVNALFEAGLVSSPYTRVKLLSKGEVTKKLTVNLEAASESAIAAIQNSGGTYEKIDRLARPKTSAKEDKAEDNE